jgi:hypothetical protein
MMIAKLPAPDAAQLHATQYDNKEVIRHYHVIGLFEGRMIDFIDCRLYMGKSPCASVVYASIWVKGEPTVREGAHPFRSVYTACALHVSGRGQAGGYGYHKPSAAIDAAIRSAGITLEYTDSADKGRKADISGVGDEAIREALEAIARACGAQGEVMIVQ